MALKLAPEIESAVRENATREGMNASDYIARLLQIATPPAAVQPAPRQAPRLQVVSPEQAIRRNAPSVRRLETELAEAQDATPDEIAEAQAEWQSLKQSLDENRRATGERPLFVPPAEP